MKKLKTLMVALGAVAMTGSALAIPTLIISDGTTSTSVTSASGIVTYSTANFDGAWSVVISSGSTKPADGSATNPFMDLSITATALTLNPARNLTVTFFDTGFGPFSGGLNAILSGHVTAGTGQPVTFNTFWDAANTGGAVTSLTSSGSLAPPSYNSNKTGSISDASPFSLTEVVTITGAGSGPGGSYSLDASLSSVPDGGTTVMLLGAALSGLAFLRRKLA